MTTKSPGFPIAVPIAALLAFASAPARAERVAVGAARAKKAAKHADAENKKPEETLRRWWIGAGLHVDFVQMPSGTDLCHLTPETVTPAEVPNNSKHIYCTDSTGADFPARSPQGVSDNSALSRGSAGESDGSTVLGDLRAFASIDYAANANVLVGLRGGWVFLRYPGKSAVTDGYAVGNGFYGEARVTYVVGEDALMKEGVASILFAGAGISAFDAHTSGNVTLNAAQVPVDMWWTNGPLGAFIDVGGGIRYAPSPQVGLIGALRLNLSFGNSGVIPTLGPEIGVQVGL